LKHASTAIVLFTLLLSINAVANNYFSFYSKIGRIDPIYLAFSIIGLVGSIWAVITPKKGKWLMVLFYAPQVIFIYGESWRFVLHPGLEFSVKILNGSINTAFQNPVGFGVNFLAIAMIFLTIAFVGANRNNNARQEEAR
jgi:hypothetical protein